MAEAHSGIESTLQEHRLFPPTAEFAAQAHIKLRDEYDRMYRRSIDKGDEFWAEIARELHWFTPWSKVLDWKPPHAKWFIGGKTNLSYNCLDLQIERGRGEKNAIIWEGEPESSPGAGGEIRRITYRQLRDDVCRFANGLKKLGVKKGDRVTIYMPMVPEAAVAMLACARLGAAHSVIFGGFSSQAIADRVEDAKSSSSSRPMAGIAAGQWFHLKRTWMRRAKRQSLVKRVIVLKHARQPIELVAGRDIVVGRRHRRPIHRMPRRADGCRGSAICSLHQRIDRQAQGNRPHHRRLYGRGVYHEQICLRSARDRTSTGVPPTSVG